MVFYTMFETVLHEMRESIAAGFSKAEVAMPPLWVPTTDLTNIVTLLLQI